MECYHQSVCLAQSSLLGLDNARDCIEYPEIIDISKRSVFVVLFVFIGSSVIHLLDVSNIIYIVIQI